MIGWHGLLGCAGIITDRLSDSVDVVFQVNAGQDSQELRLHRVQIFRQLRSHDVLECLGVIDLPHGALAARTLARPEPTPQLGSIKRGKNRPAKGVRRRSHVALQRNFRSRWQNFRILARSANRWICNGSGVYLHPRPILNLFAAGSPVDRLACKKPPSLHRPEIRPLQCRRAAAGMIPARYQTAMPFARQVPPGPTVDLNTNTQSKCQRIAARESCNLR